MAFIEPNSHIKIYRGIESSSNRRPIFKTQAAQTAYFTRHLAFDYTPTTHVKYTTSRVRVGLTVAQLLGCNYLSFVNPSFGDKVYYANIVGDPVYINNECSEIEYAIDYAQTDMFNVTLEPCYNDREHLTDEDYTKSVTNPYDATIQEFWTSESLPVSKDLEDNYQTGKDQTDDSFYVAEAIIGTDGRKSMSILAVPHLTPPNGIEETWYNRFLASIEADTGQYGLFYINDFGLTAPYSGMHMSQKMVDDLFNGVFPDYASNVKMTYDLFICESSPVISSAPNYLWGDDGLVKHITLWGADANIIAVHEVPLFMISAMFLSTEDGDDSYSREFINVALPDVSSYHNKKLARYPFSYIRVETPSGDAKEFQFERFDLTNENLEVANTAQFDLNFDYNCQPELSLIPMWYKQWSKVAGVQNTVFNWLERIAFQAIPQMPYATDAFIAGIAASNADILASRTVQNQNQLNYAQSQLNYDANDIEISGYQHGFQSVQDIKDAGVGMIEAGVEGATLVGAGMAIDSSVEAGQRIMNIASRQNAIDRSIDSLNYNRMQNSNQRKMMNDSARLSLAGIERNAVYKNMKDTKPLYVSDNYRAGAGTGLAYFNDHAFIDFIVTRVKLRDSILQKYDQWFNNYGYTSGRYGVPRIQAYLSNAATGKPHFAPSGNDNVTYVKTTGAAVKAPSKTSETFWETMLDSGVQFIRGEDLA